jgi:hypothetical protein
MLNVFLHEGNSVMDMILQPRGREIRKLATEGWSRGTPKSNSDPDMVKALERFMDMITDAEYIQDALERGDIWPTAAQEQKPKGIQNIETPDTRYL